MSEDVNISIPEELYKLHSKSEVSVFIVYLLHMLALRSDAKYSKMAILVISGSRSISQCHGAGVHGKQTQYETASCRAKKAVPIAILPLTSLSISISALETLTPNRPLY